MIFLGPGTYVINYSKDAMFAEILIFSNIFVFLAVNWAQKWSETVNFSCIPFEPKFKIWRIFQTLCFFYRRLPMVKVPARSNNTWGSKGPKIAKRGHIIDTESIQQKIFNFTTTYLYWWNLPQIYILIRSFVWQNLGVCLIGCKISQEINFLVNLDHF